MRDPDDYGFGIHSNIPECCVRFFCTLSLPQLLAYNKHNRPRKGTARWRANYVVCPECRAAIDAGTVVPNALHRCTAVCVEVLKAQGLHHAANFIQRVRLR